MITFKDLNNNECKREVLTVLHSYNIKYQSPSTLITEINYAHHIELTNDITEKDNHKETKETATKTIKLKKFIKIATYVLMRQNWKNKKVGKILMFMRQ